MLVFPSFHPQCPLSVAFDRLLPVGDAGDFQAPIRFGELGCLMRHLDCIADAQGVGADGGHGASGSDKVK